MDKSSEECKLVCLIKVELALVGGLSSGDDNDDDYKYDSYDDGNDDCIIKYDDDSGDYDESNAIYDGSNSNYLNCFQ